MPLLDSLIGGEKVQIFDKGTIFRTGENESDSLTAHLDIPVTNPSIGGILADSLAVILPYTVELNPKVVDAKVYQHLYFYNSYPSILTVDNFVPGRTYYNMEGEIVVPFRAFQQVMGLSNQGMDLSITCKYGYGDMGGVSENEWFARVSLSMYIAEYGGSNYE